MAVRSPVSAKEDQELMEYLWSPDIKLYPERYAMLNYPWDKKGSSLEGITAPRKWQMIELQREGEILRENLERLRRGLDAPLYKRAVCSGRGPGKSALLGIKTGYRMSCHLGSTTIIAANGEDQLLGKTWPEIKKWHTLALNNHWFDVAATSMKPAQWFKKLLEDQLQLNTGYYYAQGQLWTEEKPDSFAGAHNPLGLYVIFDEASGIPLPIWTVAEGFFTEKTAYRGFEAYSNGRRNTGAFFECFHKFRKFWNPLQIDARTVEGVDVAQLQQIIDKYGEDSDEARIEVRGLFPKTGSKQLISPLLMDAAMHRDVWPDEDAPLIMGIDVARFGEDSTVFSYRKGRDARSIPWEYYEKNKVTWTAARAAEAIEKYDPDAVCIDGNGVGGGVVDILEDLGYNVHDVQFGESSSDERQWGNKRTECWCKAADWLEIGAIPDKQELKDDATAPEYDYVGKDNAKQLEPKKKTKARGFASPDGFDSLSLTFAVNVARRDRKTSRKKTRVAKDVDYDILNSSS